MKRRMVLAALATVLTNSAMAAPRCAGPACGGTLVLVGTHTGSPDGGIFAVRLDPRTGELASLGRVADVERPTWLQRDPDRPVVYAVSETGNDGRSQGGVLSLRVDRATGRLDTISRVVSGGGGATHLAYYSRPSTVFVANYGTGQVAAVPVAIDGSLSPPVSVMTNVGAGPSPRQKSAHAHGVVVAPGGRYVLSPDLGADKVFVYRWDGRALSPASTPWTAFPPGSGPRHLVFSRDGRFAFVTTELTGEVQALRWDPAAATLTPIWRIALDAGDYAGTRSAAELLVSPDGRFLYVSNRGANLLQTFAIDRRTGALSEVQRIDAGGKVPWSFGFDPSGRWMVVTNEASSTLNVFAIDARSGRLTKTANSVVVPKPVALAFFR